MIKSVHSFKVYSLLIATTGLLLFSSCEKRFWYRNKVRSGWFSSYQSSQKTVIVETVNLSPEFISPQFETVIQQAGLKELTKHGYSACKKDTPHFYMVIFLRVDSYYVYGSKTGINTGRNFNSIVTRQRLGEQYQSILKEKHMVKELAFSYRLVQTKGNLISWESEDGLYYFNEEKRDLKRSVGLVKYALSNVP